MEFLKSLFESLNRQINNFSLFDFIDIVVVSVIFYYLFKFISDRRAGRLAVGIAFIVFALFLSEFFNMNTLNFLLGNIVQVGFIGLLIVFQTELRTFLEKVGGSSILGSINKKSSGDMRKTMECIDSVIDSCISFSENKTGALIVFERSTRLGDVIRTGTIINSDPASFLIKNIFYNKAPLHDGALIIRDFRLYAAGCFLPLSQNENIVKNLGTRHRAAIGMSENSDSIVVVVSEETGIISVAANGELKMNYNAQSLKSELIKCLIGNEEKPKRKFINKSN